MAAAAKQTAEVTGSPGPWGLDAHGRSRGDTEIQRLTPPALSHDLVLEAALRRRQSGVFWAEMSFLSSTLYVLGRPNSLHLRDIGQMMPSEALLISISYYVDFSPERGVVQLW